MKYRFMNEHRHAWPLTTMCRLWQVARAGFYQWPHRPESDHAKEDTRLLALIRDSWQASGGGLWISPCSGRPAQNRRTVWQASCRQNHAATQNQGSARL